MARLQVTGVVDGFGVPVRCSILNGETPIAVTGIIAGAGSNPPQLAVEGYAGVPVRGTFLGAGAPSGLWVDSDDLV